MSQKRKAKVENPRALRFNTIWMVPLLAFIVAGWMIYENWASQGPQIILVAHDAEGIEAGKTKVKVHNVDVGQVKEVKLSEDFSQALITVRMNQDVKDMLHSDAKFWVVKPEVGYKGISGLDTVLSGAYIDMEPGQKGEKRTRFKMLPQPPLSTSQDKGIRIRLTSVNMARMNIGTPVHFRGYQVGHIEKVGFHVKTGSISYRIFIQAPYDSLVNDAVQFWLTPGFLVKSSASGLEVRMDSLENLLTGGISFGLTESRKPGKPVADLSRFRLYESREQAVNNQFDELINYVFLFENSISGLEQGAPVEFRGVRIGTVKEVPFLDLEQEHFLLLKHKKIPVLASIEPQRFEPKKEHSSTEYWRKFFEDCFARGLRASLKTASLITGAQVIDLTFLDGVKEPEKLQLEGYPLFPTVAKSGIQGIEAKLNALLDKLHALPLEGTLGSLNATLDSSDDTLSDISELARSINHLINAPAAQELPQKLTSALQQLNSTLAGYDEGSVFSRQLESRMQELQGVLNNLQPLLHELREQPNALIFDRKHGADRIPPKADGEQD